MFRIWQQGCQQPSNKRTEVTSASALMAFPDVAHCVLQTAPVHALPWSISVLRLPTRSSGTSAPQSRHTRQPQCTLRWKSVGFLALSVAMQGIKLRLGLWTSLSPSPAGIPPSGAHPASSHHPAARPMGVVACAAVN